MNAQTQKINFAGGPGPSLAVVLPKLETLPVAEQRQLTSEEELIARGWETIINSYVDIGRALDRIREKRLYRAAYGTFEEYCVERWGRTARWARQRIEAARVVVNLLEAGVGKSDGVTEKRSDGAETPTPRPAATLPATERVARALVPLAKEEQRYVWQEAVKASPTGKPTAVEVGAIVERRSVEASKREGEKQPCPFDDDQISTARNILSLLVQPPSINALFNNQNQGWSHKQCAGLFDELVDRGLIKDGKVVGKSTAKKAEATKRYGNEEDKSELLFMIGETLSDLRLTRVRLKDVGRNAPTTETRIKMQSLFDSAKSLYREWMAATSVWDRTASAQASQKVTNETKTHVAGSQMFVVVRESKRDGDRYWAGGQAWTKNAARARKFLSKGKARAVKPNDKAVLYSSLKGLR
jgi:hypothetical protein